MHRLISLVFSMILLVGCAGSGARAISFGTYLEEKAYDFARQRIEKRIEIRNMCWNRMMRRVDEEDKKGNRKAADKILAENMPELLTPKIIEDLLKKGTQSTALEALNEATGCEYAKTK